MLKGLSQDAISQAEVMISEVALHMIHCFHCTRMLCFPDDFLKNTPDTAEKDSATNPSPVVIPDSKAFI